MFYDRVAGLGYLCTGATVDDWIDVSTLGQGITIRTRGALGVDGADFNVSLGTGGADVTGPFEVTIVALVKTVLDGRIRLLVNGEEYLPFINSGMLLVWGEAALHTFVGWNELAGNSTDLFQLDLHVGDIIVATIRCDVPEQTLGLGRRSIRVRAEHLFASSPTCPTMVTDGTFVLDETYSEGQNVTSVGLQITNGTFDATSNYSLSRLNP